MVWVVPYSTTHMYNGMGGIIWWYHMQVFRSINQSNLHGTKIQGIAQCPYSRIRVQQQNQWSSSVAPLGHQALVSVVHDLKVAIELIKPMNSRRWFQENVNVKKNVNDRFNV